MTKRGRAEVNADAQGQLNQGRRTLDELTEGKQPTPQTRMTSLLHRWTSFFDGEDPPDCNLKRKLAITIPSMNCAPNSIRGQALIVDTKAIQAPVSWRIGTRCAL